MDCLAAKERNSVSYKQGNSRVYSINPNSYRKYTFGSTLLFSVVCAFWLGSPPPKRPRLFCTHGVKYRAILGSRNCNY